MRKLIFGFIICISSFMIYTNNVKAFVFTTTKHFTDNYVICSTGYGYCEPNLNIFPSSTTRTGSLMFTFVTDPQLILNGVSVNNGSSYFPCDIGTQLIYSDSTKQYNFVTAVCPVNIGGSGITKVKFTYDDSYINGNSFKFFMSDYYSFYEDLSSVDYSTLLNQINSNISNLNTALGGKIDNIANLATIISGHLVLIRGQIDDIKSKLDDIKNNSSSTASNTEEIKNKINDSSIDNNNATSTIDNLSSQLASDNTISSLLLLPINFINVLIDGLGGACVPYDLGELWGTHIVMPCINLYETFGTIWYLVDTGLSALIIFNMSKYFIRLFNKLTNLKDGGLEEAYS